MKDTLVNVTILVLILFLFRKYVFKLRQMWFAFIMTRLMLLCMKYNGPLKKKLFEPLFTTLSIDPELRTKKQIRILEIGVGSAANLEYYPPGSHLILEDVNPEFEGRLRERLAQFPSLQVEKIIYEPAEDMKSLASNSIDVVISNSVLCSVYDVPATLAEVKRVLMPGGKFYYFEHVEAERYSFLYFVQHFLMFFRIWPTIFCGCSVTRDIAKDIRNAGFSAIDLHPFNLNLSDSRWFFFVRAQIQGTATK